MDLTWWQILSLALVFLGAVNWLLVGLFRLDLVAVVSGGMHYGQTNPLSRTLYVVVGLAVGYCVYFLWFD